MNERMREREREREREEKRKRFVIVTGSNLDGNLRHGRCFPVATALCSAPIKRGTEINYIRNKRGDETLMKEICIFLGKREKKMFRKG